MCFCFSRFRPPPPLPPCHFWDGNSDLFCIQLVYPSSSSGISTIQHAHRLISTGTSRAWGTVGGMCCGVGFALWLVPLLVLSLGGAVARQRWLEPHWEDLMCVPALADWPVWLTAGGAGDLWTPNPEVLGGGHPLIEPPKKVLQCPCPWDML